MPHESESCRLDSAAPHPPGPALPRQMGDAAHPPEEPLHPKVDPQTPASPALLEKTKNCNMLVAKDSPFSRRTDTREDRLILQQNMRWYNPVRNSWQMKPLCTVAGGPYEAKWIQHKYLFSNTRPW